MIEDEDRWIGAVSAVCGSIVVKTLAESPKLSVFRSISVQTLTDGREFWVIIKRTGFWVQAAEMSFHCRVVGHYFRHRGESSE